MVAAHGFSLGKPPFPSTQEVPVNPIWLMDVFRPVTTTTGLTVQVSGVNTRNVLEHLDKGLSWLDLHLERLAVIVVTTWGQPV